MKRFMVYLLALIMIALMNGCSKSSDNPTGGGDDPPPPPTTTLHKITYKWSIGKATNGHTATWTDSVGVSHSSTSVSGSASYYMPVGADYFLKVQGKSRITDALSFQLSVSKDGVTFTSDSYSASGNSGTGLSSTKTLSGKVPE